MLIQGDNLDALKSLLPLISWLSVHDARLLVVDYKGGDRVSNDDSKQKRLIGELWAKKSAGKGLYLMAKKKNEQGRGVRERLLVVNGMS